MGIRQIRKSQRMTQQEFAEMLGLTQGYLSELETGKSPISDNIINLLKDHGIEYEQDLDYDPIKIPVIDLKESMTNEKKVNYQQRSEASRRFLGQFGSNLMIIMVNGDSMEPTIKHHDWVLVQKQDKIDSEGIFVFYQNEETRLRRIQKELSGRMLIINDNAKYRSEEFSSYDEVIDQLTVVGQVVGVIKNL